MSKQSDAAPAGDGMGTRIVQPVDRRDFADLKQLVEYMDERIIALERELLTLRIKTGYGP